MSNNGYLHRKGLHCGSSALRNLLAARGLVLSESLVFGLGAGLGFSLADGANGVVPALPKRFFIGRSLAFEEDLCRAVGAELEVFRFDSADATWAEAHKRLKLGEASLAYVDLFHLPYLNARGHWFGHLIALAGEQGAHDANGDPEQVLIGDNEREQLQPVALDQLKIAFSGASTSPARERVLLAIHGVQPLTQPQLREACAAAILRQRERMFEAPKDLIVWRGVPAQPGVDALRALPDELRSWLDAPDLARRLRFGAQVIEVRGNGGGLFRKLYATFLRDADALGVPGASELVQPCLASADAFTALAREMDRLQTAANAGRASLDLGPAAQLAERVCGAELAFFNAIE